MIAFDATTTKSLGVHEEYCLGFQGVADLLEGSLQKVLGYLNWELVVWVDSRTIFTFLSHMMYELQQLAGSIQVGKAEEMNQQSTLAGLLTWMINQLVSDSRIVDPWLKSALEKIDATHQSRSAGMFFLCGLDLSNFTHPSLPWDTPEARSSMGQKPEPPALLLGHKALSLQPPLITTAMEGEKYPKMTWSEVELRVRAGFPDFFQPYCTPSDFECSLNAPAASTALFVEFTCQAWLLLQPELFRNGTLVPLPANLEAAMRVWSLESITQVVDVALLARKAGPKDIKNQVSRFGSLWKLFFPEEIPGVGSWKSLGSSY
ncbi:hypothetical protein FRB95_000694, partial [Tulasnella sp. JGI-2019a]